MIIRAQALVLAFPLALLFAGPSPAAEDAPLTKLAADIKGLSLPCGRVVSASPQADSERVASCENGDRYRVIAGAKGRVVVLKLQPEYTVRHQLEMRAIGEGERND